MVNYNLKLEFDYKLSAGDGNRTREETTSLGPQPSAFDRSTTPAYKNRILYLNGFNQYNDFNKVYYTIFLL